MKVDLPWPPTVNHYWRSLPTARGRLSVIITPEGRRFRATTMYRVRALGIETVRGPVRLAIAVSRPDRRERDLDNLSKAILDALAFAGAIEADRLVHDLHLVDTYRIVAGGAIAVEITALPAREYEDAR